MEGSQTQKTEDQVPGWVRMLRTVLAVYAFAGGAVSLLGWVADVPRLTDWDNSSISTQPNTAVAAVAASIAVFLLGSGRKRAALAFGSIVAAIGITSILQLAFKIDLGINTLLLFDRPWGHTGAVSPGQMGAPASLSWSLIGTGLVLASIFGVERHAVRFAATALSVLSAGIAALSLTGYLYGSAPLYSIPLFTVIAVQTASFILAVAVALLFCVPDAGPAKLLTEGSAAGLTARRVIPAIIIVPVVLGYVMLEGEKEGLYDLAFGTAVRTLVETALLLLLLAWTAQAVRRQSRIAEERQQNLKGLADAMPQVAWIADNHGNVRYYNDRASAFSGIDPEARDTYAWQPGVHQDDLIETTAAWEAAVARTSVYEHEHRILMSDGSYRWHLSRAVPVSDGNGSFEWYGTATDIHDLKDADQRIRESEQRFSRFMHHFPGLAWIKDGLGRYVYVNGAAERAFKRKADELYGRTDAEIFPAEIAESFTKNDLRAMQSDTGVQVIESLRTDDGQLRESIVNKFPIPIADPNGPLIGGMAIDITEQRKAQLNEAFIFKVAEMIRTGSDPLQMMADISREVGEYLNADRCWFGEMDLARSVTRISDDFYRDGESLSGTYPVSDFSNPTLADLKAGKTVTNRNTETDPRTAHRFDELYRPSGMLSYINVPMLRNGEWVAYMFCSRSKPYEWSSSEIGLMEAVAERTWAAVEKLRAEKALRESDERYRLAQQTGNVGIWDWDIVQGRTYWSEQMWTLYDEPRLDIDPDIEFWNSHLHPDDRNRARDVFEQTLASGNDHHNDVFRIVRKDGSIRWIESIATIERDAAGTPVRMYGVNLDITELQVAHDELEVRVVERTQELAKANTMLLQQMEERSFIEEQRIQLLKRLFTVQEDERGRIARDIHDHLGQRLTALRLKIASVRTLCENDSVLAQRVTRLQEISELLDKEVSFLAWELRPDILDKTDFVHALEQYVVEWSRHSEVFAEFSVIGLQERSLGRDVENNLYRITQEALNNAAKYAQASRINVILEQRKENLVLIVEDNGIGFDPSDVQNRARQGFGLVGMRERASLIGGSIEIESVAGEGTTIFVRVPLDQTS